MHSMIVYKFPSHYLYDLLSWATQIMKIMIFDKIHQRKWPPVDHLSSDSPQILHTYALNDCLQVSHS